jgi:hypothetical protein
MKFKLFALLLLCGTSVFAGTHFYVGVGVGGFGGWGYYPPAPPVYSYAYPAPAYPAVAPAGSVWIPGYYYPVGPRYYWRAGYYARPPYVGAYWTAPRYYGGRYYAGYWGRHR